MPVFKRGKSWVVKFDLNGVKVWQTIKEARTKHDAERAETTIKQEIYAGRWGRQLAPVFSQFVADVYEPYAQQNKRSLKSDKTFVRALLSFFGQYRLSEISPFLIEKYKLQRQAPTVRGKPRAAASINRELETLSKILSLAVDNNHLTKNPCRAVRKLRQAGPIQRVLSIEEEQRLLVAVEDSPAYLRQILILAVETGLRRGELLGLTVDQVDFSRGEIHLIQPKTGKPKMIPLSTAARETLLEITPTYGRFFSVADVKKAWASACRRAGIENLRLHDLRHTAATRWRQAGADPYMIRDLLGHSTIRMTGTYTHTELAERRAVVEAAGVAKSLQTKEEGAEEAPLKIALAQ